MSIHNSLKVYNSSIFKLSSTHRTKHSLIHLLHEPETDQLFFYTYFRKNIHFFNFSCHNVGVKFKKADVSLNINLFYFLLNNIYVLKSNYQLR